MYWRGSGTLPEQPQRNITMSCAPTYPVLTPVTTLYVIIVWGVEEKGRGREVTVTCYILTFWGHEFWCLSKDFLIVFKGIGYSRAWSSCLA